MEDKKRLLQEAFDAALQEKQVLANQTDNADPEIRAVMAEYIMKKLTGLDMEQVDGFIAEQTKMQDELLEESFEEAVEEADNAKRPIDEIRTHIQEEMEAYFRKREASIRHRRIEIYVDEQVKARQKNKK